MKKIFLAAALLVGINAIAQEEETALVGRKGTPILPKAGDIAIGIDATPYFNYFGNMFNNTVDNKLDLGTTILHGRYYIDDNTALRVSLSIDNNTTTENFYVMDDAANLQNPLSNAKTVDSYKNHTNGFGLTVGMQKFRGYGRLRGFYGAVVSYGRNNNTEEYAYGNPMTAANPAPTTHWGSQSKRTLVINNGSTTSIGLGGLAGVEYYFAPKICLGGEIGLGYNYSWGSQSNKTAERWGGSSVVEETEITSPGDTESRLNTFRPTTYTGLYLMFHF